MAEKSPYIHCVPVCQYCILTVYLLSMMVIGRLQLLLLITVPVGTQQPVDDAESRRRSNLFVNKKSFQI